MKHRNERIDEVVDHLIDSLLGSVAKSVAIIAVTIGTPILVYLSVVAIITNWNAVLHLLKFAGIVAVPLVIMTFCDVLGWDKRRDQE